MNYIGSKNKLSLFIFETIKSNISIPLENAIFCDLFAGTGFVGRTFKNKTKSIISNDLEYYSFVLNRHYIQNKNIPKKSLKLIDSLNNIDPNEGFIYKNYSPGGDKKRQYFTEENAAKIDAIREQIEKWKLQKEISEDVYFCLLTLLLEASDKVANTASVYGAYLKSFKKTAQSSIVIKETDFTKTSSENMVYNEDANTLINDINGDILYLDPPYNSREYGANYHLLNTIAKYDTFEPKGKTGLREYSKSNFCKKGQVLKSFSNLIEAAQFKHIFLSYNNEGLMSEKDIAGVMSNYGKYSLVKKEYQRFKADKTENRDFKSNSTFEYLHILEKDR